jgi:hypothetical protein
MLIGKISSLTGVLNTMDLNVSDEQLDKYNRGESLIQNIFPNLSSEEREFLKSGITPQEWNLYFGNLSED